MQWLGKGNPGPLPPPAGEEAGGFLSDERVLSKVVAQFGALYAQATGPAAQMGPDDAQAECITQSRRQKRVEGIVVAAREDQNIGRVRGTGSLDRKGKWFATGCGPGKGQGELLAQLEAERVDTTEAGGSQAAVSPRQSAPLSGPPMQERSFGWN